MAEKITYLRARRKLVRITLTVKIQYGYIYIYIYMINVWKKLFILRSLRRIPPKRFIFLIIYKHSIEDLIKIKYPTNNFCGNKDAQNLLLLVTGCWAGLHERHSKEMKALRNLQVSGGMLWYNKLAPAQKVYAKCIS